MMWTMSIDSNEFEIEIESEVKKGYDGGWGQNMMIRHQKVFKSIDCRFIKMANMN